MKGEINYANAEHCSPEFRLLPHPIGVMPPEVLDVLESKQRGRMQRSTPTYLFQPVAIETSGAIGSRSRAFLRELGGEWG